MQGKQIGAGAEHLCNVQGMQMVLVLNIVVMCTVQGKQMVLVLNSCLMCS